MSETQHDHFNEQFNTIASAMSLTEPEAEFIRSPIVQEMMQPDASAPVFGDLQMGTGQEATGGQNPNQASGSESASTTQPIGKPNDLENTLAGMQSGPDRQSRFIMTGDPQVISDFWSLAQERGKVYMSGGERVLDMSMAESAKLFAEAAKGRNMQSEVIADIELQRKGNLWERFKADGLGFTMFKQDELRVFAAGNADTIAKKRDELAGALGKLLDPEHNREEYKEAGFIDPARSNVTIKDGRLETTNPGEPIKIAGEVRLADLLMAAKGVVEPFQRQQAAIDAEVKEMKASNTSKSVAEWRADQAAKAAEAELHAKFQDPRFQAASAGMDELYAQMAALERNPQALEQNQEAVIGALAKLRDVDAKGEFLTLQPDMVAVLKNNVALEALLIKANDGELPPAIAAALREPAADGSGSIASKLEQWIAADAATWKGQESIRRGETEGLVSVGLLAPDQAERMQTYGTDRPFASERNPEEVDAARARWDERGFGTPPMPEPPPYGETPEALKAAEDYLAKKDWLVEYPLPLPDMNSKNVREFLDSALNETYTLYAIQELPRAIREEKMEQLAVDMESFFRKVEAGETTLEAAQNQRLLEVAEERGLTRPDMSTEQLREGLAYFKNPQGLLEPISEDRLGRLVEAAEAKYGMAQPSAQEVGMDGPAAATAPREQAPGAEVAQASEVSPGKVAHAESLAGQLSAMLGDRFVPEMRAPDGVWNDDNIRRVVQEVAKLDPGAVAQLEPEMREGLLRNAGRLIADLDEGRLGSTLLKDEGFNGYVPWQPEARAAVSQMESFLGGPAEQQTDARYDRKVEAPGTAQEHTFNQAPMAGTAERSGADMGKSSGVDAEASKIADVAIRSAYHEDELTGAYMATLIKAAARLDDFAVKSLPLEDQARMMAALGSMVDTLAQAKRDGEFPDERKWGSVSKAMDSLNARIEVFANDPASRDTMREATTELNARIDERLAKYEREEAAHDQATGRGANRLEGPERDR